MTQCSLLIVMAPAIPVPIARNIARTLLGLDSAIALVLFRFVWWHARSLSTLDRAFLLQTGLFLEFLDHLALGIFDVPFASLDKIAQRIGYSFNRARRFFGPGDRPGLIGGDRHAFDEVS